MKANHKQTWVSVVTGRGRTEVELQPGQFIFGRKKAADELNMAESSIRNRIDKLKKMRNLDIKTDTHFSIISIMNWDTYQHDEIKKDRQVDTQRTGKGQAKDTDKKDKNVKNEKKYSETSDEVQLSKYLFDKIRERKSDYKKPNIQKWAQHIDLMIRIDLRRIEEIRAVIDWCQADDFWQDNILSTKKLRQQYDKLVLKMRKKLNGIKKTNRSNDNIFLRGLRERDQ